MQELISKAEVLLEALLPDDALDVAVRLPLRVEMRRLGRQADVVDELVLDEMFAVPDAVEHFAHGERRHPGGHELVHGRDQVVATETFIPLCPAAEGGERLGRPRRGMHLRVEPRPLPEHRRHVAIEHGRQDR